MTGVRFAYLIEPPFNYLDAKGEVTGCDVELARYVFECLGIEPEFVETEFADLLPGLAQGKWQMTTGLFATAERQKQALFSRPIWSLPDGLLIRAADAGRLTGYRDLAADSTACLAVVREQVQHQTARDLGVPAERIIEFETYTEAAQAMLEGRADAYASVARAHVGFLGQNPAKALSVAQIPAVEKAPASGCFAFAKADVSFRRDVDGILATFLGGSAHRKLMNRFGFSDAAIDLLFDSSSNRK